MLLVLNAYKVKHFGKLGMIGFLFHTRKNSKRAVVRFVSWQYVKIKNS